jgi:hypothetical protein
MNETFTPKDARVLWSCIPSDCKTNLAQLKSSGRWEEAKPAIIKAAAAGLKPLGQFTMIDIASALEIEAGRWLERANQ